MQFNRDANPAKYQIKKYAADSITVNEQIYQQSILLLPNYLALWPVQAVQDLQVADLRALLDFKPELILLGSGAELVLPRLEVYQVFSGQAVGFEVMNTPAACRTFVALSAEGRVVLAALIVGGN